MKIIKIILPVSFLALGLFGALATNATEKNSIASGSVFGYKKINELCVQTGIVCDQVPNFLCKAPDGSQLYGLISNETCPIMLYKSNP